MNLTPEEKKVGQDNYHEALGAMDKSDYADGRGVIAPRFPQRSRGGRSRVRCRARCDVLRIRQGHRSRCASA